MFSKIQVTVISTIIAFTLSFFLLIFIVNGFTESNYISSLENKFYNQNFVNEKKIFILGASPMNAINPIIVNDAIQLTHPQFKVYNLAKGSDDPEKRKSSLDLIIKSKPDIVLYGIGYRDFQQKVPARIDEIKTVESILPNPKEFVEKLILANLNFYSHNLDFFKNPKLSTLQFLKEIYDRKNVETSKSNNIITDENYPLRTPEQVSSKYIMKSDEQLKKLGDELKPTFERYGIELMHKNRMYLSLQEIIETLEKNNIKVIIFTYPHHKYYLENIPDEDSVRFDNIIYELERENNISIKLLHNEYSNKKNWADLIHIYYNYELDENNEDSISYSNDIANLILNVIE